MQTKTLPKRIWFLWFQGKTEMPEIVKMCYKSWQHHNPNWEIVFLEDNNLNDFIDFKSELNLYREKIPLQAQSDIIRINLLNKFGGVWVDSTCYCTRSLDSWLPKYLDSGFFAFSRPNTDRMISSWFLAANKNNHLVETYCTATNLFWRNNPPLKVMNKNENKTFLESILFKFLTSKPANWHTPFIKNNFSFSHYFWFHYLFEHLYKRDAAFKEAWDSTKKVSANLPHKLMHHGFAVEPNEEIKKEISQPEAPLFKLNWRIPMDNSQNTTLGFLLEHERQQ